MLKGKYILLYAFMLLVGVSCKKNVVNGSIAVEFIPKTPEITVAKIIPLETREDALLNENYKLYSTSGYYIAQDNAKIVVYNKEGKINKVIKPIGRGPAEVISLSHIWADENSIKILDSYSKKIIEYDYNGEFVKALELDYQPTGFCSFTNGFLFEFQNGGFNENVLAFSDAEGKIVGSDIEIIGRNVHYGTEKFQAKDGYVLYLPSHYNTVFRIDDSGQIDTCYSFDFGKHWADKNTVDQFENPVDVFELWRMLQEKDMVGFLKFKETDGVILLNFEKVDESYNWFYNKENGEQYLVVINENDRTIAGSRVLGVEGDSFIFEIPAFGYRDYDNLPPLEVEDTDNPVLLIGQLNS